MRDGSFIVQVDKMLEEIYPDYLLGLNEIVLKLKKSLENNDRDTIKYYAHQVAGNAGSYGLEELGKMAQKLEEFSDVESLKSLELSTQVTEIENYLQFLEVEFI